MRTATPVADYLVDREYSASLSLEAYLVVLEVVRLVEDLDRAISVALEGRQTPIRLLLAPIPIHLAHSPTLANQPPTRSTHRHLQIFSLNPHFSLNNNSNSNNPPLPHRLTSHSTLAFLSLNFCQERLLLEVDLRPVRSGRRNRAISS
jgi:hypothetical protein